MSQGNAVANEESGDLIEKDSPYVLGIDLGTSTSIVSVYRKGRAEVVDIYGQRVTPSVVNYRGDSEPLVGLQAKRRALIDPDRTVVSIKRDMGDPDYKREVDGNEITPEGVSALILEYLKNGAQEHEDLLGTIKYAVIAIPANFNNNQRAATLEAGKMAGLEVLRLVEEPVATAIAYGFGFERDETILVYDLGAGTFDVCILKVDTSDCDPEEVPFRVLGKAGVPKLGGDDFDEVVMKMLAQSIVEQGGPDVLDLESDQGIDKKVLQTAQQVLKEKAEQAKIEWSEAESTQIDAPGLIKDKHGRVFHLSSEITREQFNEAIRPLLHKTRVCIKQAMEEANVEIDDLDRVIHVGGSTRMPAIRQLVADLLMDSYGDIHPVTAVSQGAAILGATFPLLSEQVRERPEGDRNLEGQKIEIATLSHFLGIQTEGQRFDPVLEKNTDLPCENKKHYTTHTDNMPELRIEVFQFPQETEYVDMNIEGGAFVGELHLGPLTEAPAGAFTVEVVFSMDKNGMLHVSANSLGDEELSHELEVRVSVPCAPGWEASRRKVLTERREVLSEEGAKLFKELENASELLPTPIARMLKRAAQKASHGQPPNVADATRITSELLRFVVDCLLAEYFGLGQHDLEIIRLLYQDAEHSGALRFELAERLICLGAEGHIPAQSETLVRLTELLLAEERFLGDSVDSQERSGVKKASSCAADVCLRLTNVVSEITRSCEGFVLFAGYGDSVYRFQGTSTMRVEGGVDLPIPHGECVLGNTGPDEWLSLAPFWEVGRGPSLRRRSVTDVLPLFQEWNVEKMHVFLIGAPLQNLIVDAIVISNDPSLSLGTFTATSVAQAAGEEFRRQIRDKQAEFGSIVSTPAGALAAKEVYHACTVGGIRSLRAEDLYLLIAEVLRLAEASGHASVAFPLLGTNYGLEPADIGVNYLRAFREHAQESRKPMRCVLSAPNRNAPIAEAIAGELDGYAEKAAFTSRKARVFISANHIDYRYAAEVYRFLKSRGVAVFFCEESLPQLGSSDFRKQIDRALDDAEHMIVVCSSVANVESPWVEAEWGFFINEKRSGRKRGNLVTVVVGSLSAVNLPPSLRYYEVMPFDPQRFPRLCQYVEG